nr:reverse transcriptase domain-containing protein [Tanacetum cinerariifolium]
MPLRKRARFTTLASGFEVGENSAATTARQPVLDVATVDATPGSMLLESEARHAREAWSHSMNCSKAVHAELQAYRAQLNTLEIQIQTRDTHIGSLETLVETLKIPPKKRTVTTTTTTTTSMTDAQLKALIAQGVTDALIEIKATKPAEIVTTTMTLELVAEGKKLALMCGRMFPEESDQVENYVGGLPNMIQGSVMVAKPKTMQEAIEIANDLMDQKICSLAQQQAKNKRKFEDTSRNNQNQ